MWKCCFDQSESVQSEEMRTEMVMRCDVKEEDWTWEMAKKDKGVEGGQVKFERGKLGQESVREK